MRISSWVLDIYELSNPSVHLRHTLLKRSVECHIGNSVSFPEFVESEHRML
jgi:hypothetical protein